MAERLSQVLSRQRNISLETRLETLSTIIENAISMVVKLPDILSREMQDIEHKLIGLEDRIITIDNDITELRIINEDDGGAENAEVDVVDWLYELRNSLGVSNNKKRNKHRRRNCYDCGSRLNFDHFCSSNKWRKKEWLEKLWNHPFIEILCCSCHDRFIREEREQTRREETDKALESLVEEEREALAFIERKLNRRIMLTDELKFRFMNELYFPREFTVKDGHISGLKLRQCNFTSLLPEIQVFSKLEILDLSSNRLRSLPDWITSLSSLIILDITRNYILEVPKSLFENKRFRIFPSLYKKIALDNEKE